MRYTWQQPDSLIKDVEFYAPHKEREALIYAPEGAAAEKLQGIAEALRLKGFVAEADMQDEHYVLRVSKFGATDEVLNVLRAEHVIAGDFTKEKTRLDVKEPFHFDGKQLGALMQVGADLALIPAALGRGPAGVPDAVASLKWIGAYGMLAAFGKKDPDKQTQYIFQDIQRHLGRAGFEFSADDAAALAAHAGKEGVFAKIEQFIREHPVEINSAIQMSGGLNNIKAGRAQTDYDGNANWLKTAGGVTTFTGNLVGGVLGSTFQSHPRKHDVVQPDGSVAQENVPEDDKPQGLTDRFIHWVREKPLRITGSLSFVSNTLRIASGLVESKKYKDVMGSDGKGEKDGRYFQDERDHERNIGIFYKRNKAEPENKQISAAKGLIEDLALTRKHIQEDVNPKGIGSIVTHAEKPRKPRSTHEMRADYEKLHEAQRALLAKYDKVAHTRQAAKIDYMANGVKMLANIFIASSSSKIDSDLKKTGHLGEICNFLAHVAHNYPEAERGEMVNQLAGILAGKNGVEASERELAGMIGKKLAVIENNPWEKGSPEAAQGTDRASVKSDDTPVSVITAMMDHAMALPQAQQAVTH